ncbi:hypothetical protein [Priestia megaterium]|uniref:hypothetical protein n=1 Tax=Priestia megaterium TaxID=1404 RepID=UPI0025A42520|nr:hypothetical protein [Priestia megaterium]MDM8148533.1 hypothetical protein [Priestia megaterium]
MIEFILITIGIIVFTLLDYFIFDQENKRWRWFSKRSQIQKILICTSILLIILTANIASIF